MMNIDAVSPLKAITAVHPQVTDSNNNKWMMHKNCSVKADETSNPDTLSDDQIKLLMLDWIQQMSTGQQDIDGSQVEAIKQNILTGQLVITHDVITKLADALLNNARNILNQDTSNSQLFQVADALWDAQAVLYGDNTELPMITDAINQSPAL